MTWVRQTVTTVAAIGLALWLPAPALADTATSTAGPALATPGLAIVPTSPSFRGGAAVTLAATLTNRSQSTCALVDSGDLAVQVVDARLNDAPLAPSYGRALIGTGAGQAVTKHAKTTSPNGSVTFEIGSAPFGSVDVLTPLPDGSAFVTAWPVTAQGQYEFRLLYQAPALAGAGACQGASSLVTVHFAVIGADGAVGTRWWVVGGVVAVALLAVLLLAVLLIRRRRGRRQARATTAVALALLCAAAGLGVDVRPAHADVSLVVGDDDIAAPMAVAWGRSLRSTRRCGMNSIRRVPPPSTSFRTTRNRNTSRCRAAVRGIPPFLWNFYDKSRLLGEEKARLDPCASLYHELVHALDRARGQEHAGDCGDTKVPYDEVRATIEENKFRARYHLDQRDKYDGKKIPKALADCDKKKAPPKRADNSRPVCRGVNGCASTNGDPHLFTFDGARYDFQAVGEFTAVASSRPDLRIQARQSAYTDSRTIAVNTAFAMLVGSTRLGFYLEQGTVLIRRDGQPFDPPRGDTALTAGATLTRNTGLYWGDSYTMTWADGTRAWIDRVGTFGLHLTVDAAAARKATLSGLLGTFDGEKGNDVAAPAGAALPLPALFEQLYPSFADGWRITDATSLFDYPAGQSTASFTDRGFPLAPRDRRRPTSCGARRGADGLCPARRYRASHPGSLHPRPRVDRAGHVRRRRGRRAGDTAFARQRRRDDFPECRSRCRGRRDLRRHRRAARLHPGGVDAARPVRRAFAEGAARNHSRHGVPRRREGGGSTRRCCQLRAPTPWSSTRLATPRAPRRSQSSPQSTRPPLWCRTGRRSTSLSPLRAPSHAPPSPRQPVTRSS